MLTINVIALFLLVTIITASRFEIEEIFVSKCPRKYLPYKIHLKIDNNDLILKKEDQKLKNVEIQEKGKLKNWRKNRKEIAGVFSDLTSDASFTVAFDSKIIMYGSFTNGHSYFSIRPLFYNSGQNDSTFHRSNYFKNISVCGYIHVLEREVYNLDRSMVYDDVVVDRLGLRNGGPREQGNGNERHFILTEQQFKLLNSIRSHSKHQKLIIELYVVIDYSIYKHWLDLYRTNDKAIRDLRYYYAHIVNGMSNRYKAMNLADVEVSVSIAGYYIAKTKKDAPFTTSSKVAINSTMIDVYKSLDYFFDWIKEKIQEDPPSLPRFDAAMLFTRQTLAVINNSTNKVRTISGLADIGALCQVNSVSIVKDFGLHGAMDTATHELAHNLGANHDGDRNDCYSSSQHIMALAPNKVTDDMYNNTLTFSNCSKEDFLKYIAKLDKEEHNCMLDGWESDEKSNITSFLQSHAGSNYSLNQQCQIIFGKNSFFCGGGGLIIKDLCKEMFCFRPTSQSCKTDVQLKAADGTSCGNKEWCQKGHCTPDENAPEFDDFCPFGDFKDKIPIYGSVPISCSQLRQKRQGLCYNKFYKDLCCQTCAKLKTEVKGCEYGDRDVTRCSKISPSVCYSDVMQEECCQSCTEKIDKKLPENCRYGDKADWCTDKKVFKPLNCYYETDRHICCKTCNKVKKDIEGCEFGDKGPKCKKDQCTDPNFWEYCCETCAEAIKAYRLSNNFQTTSTQSIKTPISTFPDKETSKCAKDKATWCSTLKALQCYSSHETCCKKCQEFYRPEKIGCEYGDKSYECKAEECTGENYIQSCCDTCSSVFIPKPTNSTTPITTVTTSVTSTTLSTTLLTKIHTSQHFAQDTKIPNFVDEIKINKTYSNTLLKSSIKNSTFTQSSKISTTLVTTLPPTSPTTWVYPIECAKGDRASWCTSIKASQCYKSQTTCCKSCEKFYNPSIFGCEYGDKATWCEKHVAKSPRDCRRPSSSVGSVCCHSCSESKLAIEEMEETRDNRGVEWLCKAGDQASYCTSITQAHSCYSYQRICCASCTRFLDHTIPDCPFGDKVTWCSRYRNDERTCRRNDISSQCCKTCAPYVYNGKIPRSGTCRDQASWCNGMKASQCYHKTAQTTCCATCHHFADGNEGDCRYGDKLSWCEPQFCKTNAKECCRTCAQENK